MAGLDGEPVYLSISLNNVPRDKAHEIVQRVVNMSPGVDINTHYADAIVGDDSE